MFKRIVNAITFYFDPPTVGDVFWADPFHFIVGKPVESVLHGLRDKNGVAMWMPGVSFGTYKLKIIFENEVYYQCECEALCFYLNDNSLPCKWMKRSQARKISKRLLKEMAVNSLIERIN